MKCQYDLELNELMEGHGSGLMITRVPGGWIYQVAVYADMDNETWQAVFVPHSEEFRPTSLEQAMRQIDDLSAERRRLMDQIHAAHDIRDNEDELITLRSRLKVCESKLLRLIK